MVTENIYTAKTHLSRLIELVLEGEEVVIARAGKPLVRIIPYTPPQTPVIYGLYKGNVVIDEDFNDYSEEVAEMFAEYEPGDEECRS